jgi:hypothetical protein
MECKPTGCGKDNQKRSSPGEAVNSEGMANYTNPQKRNQVRECVCVLLGVKKDEGVRAKRKMKKNITAVSVYNESRIFFRVSQIGNL